MITVRIRHTDPATHASFVIRVTAESIRRALVLVPGKVLMPIPEDAFDYDRQGIKVENVE